MIGWIRRRPVLAYFGLALLLSWTWWLSMAATGQRVMPGSAATHLPGLAGPAVAAFVITAIAFGGAGVRRLLASSFLPPRPLTAGLALTLAPIAIAAVAFLVLAVLGAPLPGLAGFSAYPGLPENWPLWLLFLVALILNGYGEEAGWRGFATHHLVPSLGRFRGTLVVAAMWLVWHAPMFLIHAGMQDLIGLPLLGWVVGLVGAAFVLAFVYLASGSSILAVAFWHTFYNFTVATPAGQGTAQAAISTIILAWGVVIAIIWWRSGRVGAAPR